MKRYNFYLILFSIITISSSLKAQQVIVTDNASYTTPASGAMLDVNSTSKGFMPPRVALVSITDVTTIANPSTGLVVYNTGDVGLTVAGLYYWNGTIWTKPMTGGTGDTNYMAIADDGTVTLNGAATTYNDLLINPSTARNNGNNVPTWALFVNTNMFTWTFADGSLKEVTFTVQLPHDYKEGSTIFPHVHWSSTAAPGTQRIKWVLEYQWVNHESSFAASSSSSESGFALAGVTGRSVAAYEHIITPLGSGISGTGKTISSVLVCRLYRDGAAADDTFTGDAFLLSTDFHYEIDSFGSRNPFVK
ncbi:MAG: hypothetical protein GZ091_09675 [Paludibacter sp.]|nr:hypothetical protein [Paludibacter sp.]